jgi:hypothetical protein
MTNGNKVDNYKLLWFYSYKIEILHSYTNWNEKEPINDVVEKIKNEDSILKIFILLWHE